ncbi:phosphatidylinositol-glycan biosynthesis class W protein [Spea bombifrons]|uniref:phosphatidylinositol-glycan biosynthesis class W protein n=1 Tax=Spea bombifrons TaxID=233779 RepID=UPI00234B8984|nr:phosphatidylinositol-glycan biosynthesis class W protein [Spea bombifrons]
MAENKLKEAFISNLNGTTITEISVGLTVTPLCILCRGLVFVFYHQIHGEKCFSWKFHLILDFFLLVLPHVLSCTVLSDYLILVPLVIAGICIVFFITVYRTRNNHTGTSLDSICKYFVKVKLENQTVPSVTTLRVFINLLTAISILAVDFPIFPRRYAKTETYGTGVMDLGVGGFIFGNALVSPEARLQNGEPRSKLSTLRKQLLSVWPLIVLGFGRLISVKSIDYHEHVSEYGIHWNFFFTLAIVKTLASLLLAFVPAQKSWIAATIVVFCYQFLLEMVDLKNFILHGSDRKGTRVGFLNANREGLFSAVGYLAIYMAGVQVGLYILKKRTLIKEWMKLICDLMLTCLLMFMVFYVVNLYLEPASRRLANLTFCVWIVTQYLFWLCSIIICDLILAFAQYVVIGSKVPSTWKLWKSSYFNKKHDSSLKDSKQENVFCLIDAVGRNQLLFFLLSNIMTGLVNMMFDTIHSSGAFSLTVLLLYMFTNCIIIYFLHIKNVTVKCW